MKRILVTLATILTVASSLVFAQTPKPSPPKSGDAELAADKTFQAELVRIVLAEEEEWREFSFPDDRFKARFPRTPAERTEVISDPVLGAMNMNLFLGMGEDGGFAVGHLRLPFAVKDPEALKSLYKSVVHGMLEEGFAASETSDIEFKGFPALRLVGKDADKTPVDIRVFMADREMFMLMLIAVNLGDGAPPTSTADMKKATDFLNSFEILSAPTVAAVPEDPIFKSSFTDSIYRSEFFGFSMTVPKEWHLLEQSDVADLQSLTRRVLTKPGTTESKPQPRHNLFTFAMAALGADDNSSIACNLIKAPSPTATAKELAFFIRKTLLASSVYKSVTPPVAETIGGVTFERIDAVGELAGARYDQKIYFVVRRGYGVVFTLSAFKESDMEPLIKSLKTLKFDPK